MARADIKMPDELLEKLAHLAKDEDGMAERVLNAGAEVVEAKVRSNLAGAIGRGTKEESRSTGQLLASLGTSGVKLDRDGNHNVKGDSWPAQAPQPELERLGEAGARRTGRRLAVRRYRGRNT